MHDEYELRSMLASTETPSRIDVDAVVRRSRARRRPKQVAAGAVGALVVLGLAMVAVPAIVTPTPPDAVTMSEHAAEGGESAADSALRVAADSLNQCGGPLALPAENSAGLTLEVIVPETAAPGDEVTAAVLLTNTGPETVTGTTGAVPTVALARDGVVVWHTGPTIQSVVEVQLEPGEHLELPMTFQALECGSERKLRAGALLELVPAGDYQVSVAIDVATDAVDEFGAVVALVVAPPASITIE